MSNRFLGVPLMLAFSCCSLLPAASQQNWINNTAGQIQQDAGAGVINGGQAAALQNRDAQIQAQEQRYLQQNGGTLTSGERHQISGELNGLNRRLGADAARNTGGIAPGIAPGFAPGYMPANAPLGWQGRTPGYLPAQYQTNPNQYQQYPHRHHHHNGTWGQNGNGYNGNQQNYWGH